MSEKTQNSFGKKSEPKGSNIKFLARLIPYTFAYKWLAVAAILALCAAAFFDLLIPQGIRMLVDKGLTEGDSTMLLYSSLAIALVALFYGAASALQSYLVQKIGSRIVRDIRNQVFNKVVSQGIPYFDKNRVGDIISRLNSDVSTLGTFVSGGVSMALANIIMLIAILGIMIASSWMLALIVFGFIFVLRFALKPLENRMKAHSADKQNALASTSICVDENISGIRTVQAFNQTKQAQNAFAEKADDVAKASINFGLAQGLFLGVSQFTFFAIIAALFFAGGLFMINGTMSAGEFTAFMVYAFFAMHSGGALVNFIGSLNQTAGATKRLFEILDAPLEMPEPENPRPLPKTVGPRGMSLEGVSFSYPSRPDQEVLRDLNIQVAKGETVAIVGPSGAGKSTLFSMLMRYYDPSKGKVYLDGVNVSDISRRDLHGALAPVPQDPSMFSTTVYNNILYGRPDACRDEVIAAAKAAHAHEFIEGLADGYDTYVGEKGVQLSGGQKQRIAIARAFLCQPQVLLLDEATSNLDAQSEQAIKQALDEIRQGRTTLIIAHRLATVIHADRILVMEDGNVVAEGTHGELMESNDLYGSLVRLQMLRD